MMPPFFQSRAWHISNTALYSSQCSGKLGGLIVDTTDFCGAGHAVETMDSISQAPSLPVKIYLDEIDKLRNYESNLP